jgi:hypothetical protein
MSNIQRLRQGQIQNGQLVNADDLNAEIDQLLNQSNTHDDLLLQNSTLTGTKTFAVSPIVPTPTQATHAVNKGYIDGIIPTGVGMVYWGVTAPAGWLICRSDETLGKTGSGATYLDDTYQALFNLIWSNTSQPIYDSSGSASTRGASASADWTALKRIPLYEGRNRALVGLALSDTAITNAMDATGQRNIIGGKLGAESHVLTINQMPSHTHGFTDFITNSEFSSFGGTGQDGSKVSQTQATGGGQAHNNIQPVTFVNHIIKL